MKKRKRVLVVRRKKRPVRTTSKKVSKKPFKKIEQMVKEISIEESKPLPKESLRSMAENFSKSGSFGTIKASEEEIALELASLYFREIARLGFKRSLEIDDVINSYYYALARIKRKDFESEEIMSVIRRAKKY